MAEAVDVAIEWALLADVAVVPEWLSDAERRRRSSMWPAVGDRWAASRCFVRERLGAMLELPPAAVPLVRAASGAPVLHGMQAAVSIAHSSAVVMVALAAAPTRLGVDVEGPAPADDLVGLAKVVGTDREVAALAGLDHAERPMAFQRWWVRKEAVLKAAGTGFLADPRRVDVGVLEPSAPPPWRVHDLGALAAEHVAAIATDAEHSRLSVGSA